uniref:Uncharacterized protein n=1 Tax=Arundo donax TaxID=35708 RepID=A0A0A9GGT9_ARUDO
MRPCPIFTNTCTGRARYLLLQIASTHAFLNWTDMPTQVSNPHSFFKTSKRGYNLQMFHFVCGLRMPLQSMVKNQDSPIQKVCKPKVMQTVDRVDARIPWWLMAQTPRCLSALLGYATLTMFGGG